MIRLYDIQEAFAGLVGWEQSYNPNDQIEEGLTESESGLTFQGAHPLVTLNNIRAIMPEDWDEQYPAYVPGANYYEGDKVKYGGGLWIATAFSTGEVPAPGAYWRAYSSLSDFLQRLTTNGINTVVQTFLQAKQLKDETRSLVERRTFFDGAARLEATITPKGRLVGIEIVPVRAMGVTTKIERIGLQMVGGTGKVKLYVFHSSQYLPYRELELDYTNASGGFQWFNLAEPLYLPYIWPRLNGDDSAIGNDAGGAWFICYNQDELPDGMRALNVSKDWSVEPCQACLGGSIEGWRQITKYMQLSPFSTRVPAEWPDGPCMFDIGELNYTNTMNYGLNAEVSVGCDLTDFIISQRGMFATVLQKQVAVGVLRTIAMNPDVRVNRNQVNATRDEILYEVDGAPQGRASGLGYELQQAYKALELDTRGLDRICLSCNNHGVKYRTV